MSRARRCAPGARWRLPRASLLLRLRALAIGAALSGGTTGVRADGDEVIPGLSEWADAVTRRSNLRWVGQRVAEPDFRERPDSSAQLQSLHWPLRVLVTGRLSAAALQRAGEVLATAEQTLELGAATGLLLLQRPLDLYVLDSPDDGAFTGVASVWSELDAREVFACVDARTPRGALPACVAEVLIDGLLLGLDPAESSSLRRASAAYFARLLHGESCTPTLARSSLSFDQRELLRTPAALRDWLDALGAARDHNRGVFIANMWQFARQLTWDGEGLRGSPDLIEAIAKALELNHERLEEVAAALAASAALRQLEPGPIPTAHAVRYSALPAHLAPSAPLWALDASLRLIDLEQPRPGEQLTIWARGEAGVRWALGVTRLDADGQVLAQQIAPVLKVPDTELKLELDAETRFVLVAVVNMGPGVPDADWPAGGWEHAVRVIVDRGR